MVLPIVAFILIAGQEVSPEAKVAIATQELAAAKADYIKARDTKRNLAEASFKYGAIVVESPVLGPSEKYPLALALFRQTLKLEPNNADAAQWEETIIGIYAGLGKEPAEVDLSQLK